MDIDLHATLRAMLVFGHLLALLAAVAGMAMVDLALLSRVGSLQQLRLGCWLVIGALALLWLSGLAIVSLDTGWQLEALLDRPKLQAKVLVVLALTANGVMLHRMVFAHVDDSCELPQSVLPRATVLGAMSAASWIYAIFLGLAAPFAPLFGLSGFLALYGVVLLVAQAVARRVVLPRMTKSPLKEVLCP